jgi:hypothetical protein
VIAGAYQLCFFQGPVLYMDEAGWVHSLDRHIKHPQAILWHRNSSRIQTLLHQDCRLTFCDRHASSCWAACCTRSLYTQLEKKNSLFFRATYYGMTWQVRPFSEANIPALAEGRFCAPSRSWVHHLASTVRAKPRGKQKSWQICW